MSATQNFFIHNGVAKPVSLFSEDMLTGSTTIYEVIKVINSTPVFFDEHLQRMQSSVEKAGISYSVKSLVSSSIRELLRLNPVERNNIRVAAVFANGAAPSALLVYFIASKYPTPIDYQNGVQTATISAERSNPTAKIENRTLRDRANRAMEQHGYYEVQLVNTEGSITEGSRSNTFFIKKDTIITAPDHAVLGGITRDVVLRICHKHGYRVEMRCLPTDELQSIDAMFITGTSPCVLPVRQCNAITYNPQHPITVVLTREYGIAEAESMEAYGEL